MLSPGGIDHNKHNMEKEVIEAEADKLRVFSSQEMDRND